LEFGFWHLDFSIIGIWIFLLFGFWFLEFGISILFGFSPVYI